MNWILLVMNIILTVWAVYIWRKYSDKEFLYFFGAEIIFEIAKFWASLCRYNPERERFTGIYDFCQ